MPDDHPTPAMLDRLLAGASTSEESTWVLAHLVGRCETCSRYVRGALARAGRPPAGPEAYDQAFASSLARSSAEIPGIHAEQLEAAALWATLEPAVATTTSCWAIRHPASGALFGWHADPARLALLYWESLAVDDRCELVAQAAGALAKETHVRAWKSAWHHWTRNAGARSRAVERAVTAWLRRDPRDLDAALSALSEEVFPEDPAFAAMDGELPAPRDARMALDYATAALVAGEVDLARQPLQIRLPSAVGCGRDGGVGGRRDPLSRSQARSTFCVPYGLRRVEPTPRSRRAGLGALPLGGGGGSSRWSATAVSVDSRAGSWPRSRAAIPSLRSAAAPALTDRHRPRSFWSVPTGGAAASGKSRGGPPRSVPLPCLARSPRRSSARLAVGTPPMPAAPSVRLRACGCQMSSSHAGSCARSQVILRDSRLRELWGGAPRRRSRATSRSRSPGSFSGWRRRSRGGRYGSSRRSLRHRRLRAGCSLVRPSRDRCSDRCGASRDNHLALCDRLIKASRSFADERPFFRERE